MSYSKVIAVTVLALAVSTPAFAGSADTPVIDKRQANQEQRIDQGIASGQLTEREAARLDRGQDRIDNMENRAKSDGVVTNKERTRIHHAQDVQNRKIYREKHDRQRR